MAFSPTYYESESGLFCLLIEHYGMPDQILPTYREAGRLCGSKALTVDEVMRHVDLPQRRRALDLGCAVGGSVFDLTRYFDQVVGVDLSSYLLERARELQRTRTTSVTWNESGFHPRSCQVTLADNVKPERADFVKADLYDLPADLGVFDLVTTEKVPECLPDPGRLLKQMAGLVAPGGYFVHISSYRWSEDFASPEKQLGTPGQVPEQLDKLLGPSFVRKSRFNVPFLLDSAPDWVSFGVAEALLWKRL